MDELLGFFGRLLCVIGVHWMEEVDAIGYSALSCCTRCGWREWRCRH